MPPGASHHTKHVVVRETRMINDPCTPCISDRCCDLANMTLAEVNDSASNLYPDRETFSKLQTNCSELAGQPCSSVACFTRQ
jgi:hypothetical protein